MLYKVSILTTLLSFAFGSRLGKEEDGSRRLLGVYDLRDPYSGGYSAPPYSGGSTYNSGGYSTPSYGGGSTYNSGGYSAPSYGGGSYGGGYSAPPSGPNFDGTYRFTCLGETFFVNVCGSQGYDDYIVGADDVAISFNVEGDPELNFHDYVFGVFRSSTGVVPINANTYRLSFTGFQFQMPTGINYDLDLSYAIIKSGQNYMLIRDEDQEQFLLEKLYDVAQQECMEPGQSFINPGQPPQPYPAVFQSVNLIDSGLCSDLGVNCFEMGIIDMIPFGAVPDNEGDSCFAVYDNLIPPQSGMLPEPITGGIHLRNGPPQSDQPDTVFDGNIVLASFIQQQFPSDNAACRVGPVFYGLDRQDGNAVILNFRCSEGQDGFTYRLFRTDRTETCPLFTPVERKRYTRPERPYGRRDYGVGY